MNKEYIHKDTKTDEPLQQELQNYFQVINGTSLYYENYVKQLEQELERYKNIIKETIEKSRCIFEDKTINDDEAFYQLGCVIDKLENVIGGETNE